MSGGCRGCAWSGDAESRPEVGRTYPARSRGPKAGGEHMSADFNVHERSPSWIAQKVLHATAYAFVSADGVLLEYGPLLARYFAFAQSMVGERVETAFAQTPSFLALVQQAVSERQDIVARLIYIERAGELAHVLVDAERVTDGEAGPGMLFICKWLDHLVTLESHIVRNDKLATAGKIAAGIAHEIRNPLTSVRGFTQMLHDQFERDKQERERSFTKLMMDEIDHVNMLVNELLLLSKPTVMTVSRVNLQEVLEPFARVVQADALLRGVAFTSTIGDTPPVLIDSGMFRQVLSNLVRNALEAMEGIGSLTIVSRFDEVEDRVRIDVSDTGPGIPNYMIDRIFDAFYTTKEFGIGLGLPICQRIVAELGGEIRVLTKGYGTTFSVLLPPAKEQVPHGV